MSNALLQVKKLNKTYGALQATKDLDLEVEKGHVHALIGPNGAGKTTLVNQLTGDILPDSGTILFEGRDITRLRDYRRARLGIARSFQITHIFENLTVAENMALSICSKNGHNFRFFRKSLSSRIVKERLQASLARVDLESHASHRAKSLSHGEKRQLEVGMALIGKPRLLILDEPMAGMGPGGTVELSRLIDTLRREVTILLVEHDMDVVFRLADRVTVLVYGENVLTAPPEQVRENEQVRRVYLGEETDA